MHRLLDLNQTFCQDYINLSIHFMLSLGNNIHISSLCCLIWYADGSHKDGRTGAGVYGHTIMITKAMGLAPTIFQTKINAIELCTSEIL